MTLVRVARFSLSCRSPPSASSTSPRRTSWPSQLPRTAASALIGAEPRGDVGGSRGAPTPAVVLDETVGLGRAPRTRLVPRQRSVVGPRLEDRFDDAPGLLDFVGADEQR